MPVFGGTPGSTPKPALIWIVDDSATQALFTERALGPQHRYERFTDGASAIERLHGADPLPDLLLLDWVMPGLSGDEVCRYLRSSPKTRDLPIVILTASRTNTEDIVRAFDGGANDYVSKPFVPEELLARVATLLRAAELAHAAELERSRIAAINGLGRALVTVGNDIPAILRELATALVGSASDGCAIALGGVEAVSRHRSGDTAALLAALAGPAAPGVRPFATDAEAIAALSPTFADYVTRFGLRGLAVIALPPAAVPDGVVILTRDRHSEPFCADDLAAIETCVDLVGLAIRAAISADADRAATRFQQELVGIVSHDLRTPLAAMSMGIEILTTRAAGDDASTGVLGRLDRSTRRMTAIVSQLLDVTRARIGQGIQLSSRPTELSAVVGGVIDELRATNRATAFTITGDPIEGTWDPDRLGQVVSNLAANAVHYGRPGGPIAVAWSRRGDTVALTVHNEIRDEPIPQTRLRALFEPFARGAASERVNGDGLGLGLYIVSEIVRAHHGAISATSDPTGTTFRVELAIG